MVKNKPKRLKRNKRWRVARRKKKKDLLINGKSRNRKPRPKNKIVKVEVKPEVKAVVKKVAKKTVKKVESLEKLE